MNRRAHKALFAASSLLLLSARQDPIPYRFSIGPFENGQDCPLTFVYLKSRYETAYPCVDVRTPDHSFVLNQKDAISITPDAEGYVHYSYTIPGSYFKKGQDVTLLYGLTRESYYRGLDASRFYVRYQCTRKVVETSGLYFFDDDYIVELPHETIVFDPRKNADRVYSSYDYLHVDGIPNENRLSRNAKVNEPKLHYYTEDFVSSIPTPTGVLRIVDHQEDFAGITEKEGGMDVIPLQVFVTKEAVGSWAISWRAARNIYYSRVDLKATTDLFAEGPKFMSRDIFVPLRQGHDAEPVGFQVLLSDVGPQKDDVVLRFSVTPASRTFGPCDSSPYCVVRYPS